MAIKGSKPEVLATLAWTAAHGLDMYSLLLHDASAPDAALDALCARAIASDAHVKQMYGDIVAANLQATAAAILRQCTRPRVRRVIRFKEDAYHARQ